VLEPLPPSAAPVRSKVVALGGGHGLFASLSALRLLEVAITAIVTVADDGGSSGRIRRELDVLPPGDLRMALAALSTARLGRHGPEWSAVLQHRLGGSGALAGHPIGNLLLTGLTELHEGDAVAALDALCGLVGARGRVLPMVSQPLDLVAEVASVDPDDPVRGRRIRGQSSIAATSGRVRSLALIPPDPPACAAAIAAIASADIVVLGPGSWFTSVIPHLLVPELAAALVASSALIVTILNLEPQVGETDDFSPEEHLRVLKAHCPDLRVDAVIADSDFVADPFSLKRYVDALGAQLYLAPVAAADAGARHDPDKLSRVIAQISGLRGSAQGAAGGNRPAEDEGVH
jgi:uncharacterized cofD-like protein